MEGVLENLRLGLVRLGEQREKEHDELQQKREFTEKALGRDLTIEELKAFKGKTVFQETMRTLNRLNASYRRCYWKSGAEMIFPILYGHMTFASHRCWTVYVKKAVFQAAEAWRRIYGSSIRHHAIKAGGGEIIQHFRQGMDPYPCMGWREVEVDGITVYENSTGRRCASTTEIYEYEMANKNSSEQLTFVQKFLNECCAEKFKLGDDGETEQARQIVTTSPLEDWLWRGDDPIVKDMTWYVYSMWVYRVETLPRKLDKHGEPVDPAPRFIDISFSSDYKLYRTHKQRIATEFRVPLYEGFTMPPSTADSETAAMFKSLLLRSLSVEMNDEPEDVRFLNAFRSLCQVPGRLVDPSKAFTTAWLVHLEQQRALSSDCARLLLDRYEYKSLWNTQEVQDHLNMLWEMAQSEATCDDHDPTVAESTEKHTDPDAAKPRITVQQYTALIGEEVMMNLEGLARARREKHPRAYQTDAEIHQSYISATTGGSMDADGDVEDGVNANAAPSAVGEEFPLVRGDYDQEEMRSILDFEHKRRGTPFLKDLLAVPCARTSWGSRR